MHRAACVAECLKCIVQWNMLEDQMYKDMWTYLVSLGLGGNREGDSGGGGVGAEGLGVQVPPHLVLPRARQTILA